MIEGLSLTILILIAMVDDDYVFPKEEPKKELTKEELEERRKTLEFLLKLPWRPFCDEW